MDLDFGKALARCLTEIPPGRVVTCVAIARALGDIRAVRAVSTWIRDHPEVPNAHRVVRADGTPLLSEATGRIAGEGVRIARNRAAPSSFVDSVKTVGFLDQLREQQERLALQVEDRDDVDSIRRIAGVDVSYRNEDAFAAAVSMDVVDLEPIEVVTIRRRAEFPYIPTYLAYREFPIIETTVQGFSEPPDLLMIDGHGRLHPVLFGIACYAGVLLDLPTVGVAKRPLVGRVGSPASGMTDTRPVRIGDRVRGYAWTPPGRSRAVFVSTGHRISLNTAMRIVRETTRQGYPEPLRIADRLSREMGGNEKREKGAKR